MINEIMNRIEAAARDYSRSATPQNKSFVEGVAYGLMLAKAIVGNAKNEDHHKMSEVE